jgi:microcystin-dependent protein
MAEPFLAEVKIFGFNFAPRGWAQCDGQILPINQNQSLYSLLGTTYGGDGRTNFGLPELRVRVPIHFASGHPQGQKSGVESVLLSSSQISHSHNLMINDTDGGNTYNDSTDDALSRSKFETRFSNSSGSTSIMDSSSMEFENFVQQGHNNMQPSLVLNYCIALQGIFPPRN